MTRGGLARVAVMSSGKASFQHSSSLHHHRDFLDPTGVNAHLSGPKWSKWLFDWLHVGKIKQFFLMGVPLTRTSNPLLTKSFNWASLCTQCHTLSGTNRCYNTSLRPSEAPQALGQLWLRPSPQALGQLWLRPSPQALGQLWLRTTVTWSQSWNIYFSNTSCLSLEPSAAFWNHSMHHLKAGRRLHDNYLHWHATLRVQCLGNWALHNYHAVSSTRIMPQVLRTPKVLMTVWENVILVTATTKGCSSCMCTHNDN